MNPPPVSPADAFTSFAVIAGCVCAFAAFVLVLVAVTALLTAGKKRSRDE